MSVKRAIYIASAIVIPLSVLQNYSLSSANLFLSSILFFALFLGMIVQTLITGGHGGTLAQEGLAPFAGATVNVLAYSLLIVVVAKLSRLQIMGRVSRKGRVRI